MGRGHLGSGERVVCHGGGDQVALVREGKGSAGWQGAGKTLVRRGCEQQYVYRQQEFYDTVVLGADVSCVRVLRRCPSAAL